MCGIVAIINKSKNGMFQNQITAFKQLLFVDQLRGTNGTGIFYNSKRNSGKIKTLRAPYNSTAFLDTKEFAESAKTLFQESNFVVGHNRAATRGEINIPCTHPFREESIILVHNGTLNYYNNIDSEKKALSDSHAIAISMHKIGEKETIEKLYGAFALIWFNTKDQTLNLCRNIQRPLYIIDCSCCFIIVSELEMGMWIAKRNNLTYTKHQEVTPKRLYKFPIENMAVWNEQDVKFVTDFTKPTTITEKYDDGFWEHGSYVSRRRNNNYNDNIKPKIFNVGDKVRFKAGYLTSNNRHGASMSGDILRVQTKVNPVYEDFEQMWRVRFYASPEKLKMYENESNLEGTVKETALVYNKVVYILEDIEICVPPKKSNILVLPKPEEVNGMTLCDWCSSPIKKGEEQQEEEYTICPQCSNQYGSAIIGNC